ncbi:MAG: DUF2164 domain-containing protein [Synechococcaceae cyanobacterium SM2_3_60]|nr:DUF2164 domain-containing protein [Synechococcaceae cyanobacterium SM2_3_60]
MLIELPKAIRKNAIASIIRYFREHRDEEIGVIAASGLLDFFLVEIAPSIHNKTTADIVKRMQMSIAELDIDFHAVEFHYWRKQK